MARKIKDTPVLTGKDARRFERKMEEAKRNPVSKEELDRIKDSAKKIKFIP